MNEWTMGEQGTATGTTRLVIADGDLLATVTPLWSDTDGVRVSIDTTGTNGPGIDLTEDMSLAQAVALADALCDAATTAPPD